MRAITRALGERRVPVGRFNGHLLFDEFAAFFENEMASRRLRPAAGQRFDKHPLGI